jgi:hypothetical protein
MKLFTGWVLSAALVFTAVTANAQGVAPHETGRSPVGAASDFGGPYAAMPPEAPVPGYGPTLLPPQEVYTVVRESGFSPLGVPRLRGTFYVIGVIGRHGDDGRLVIDARNGQVVRFVPAYRMGDRYGDDAVPPYASPGLLPPTIMGGPPRPPASVPRVASRMPSTVPLPKPSPPRAPTSVAEPVQQSAAVQAKPIETPATSKVLAPAADSKPAAPPILPTQEMPRAQGLE